MASDPAPFEGPDVQGSGLNLGETQSGSLRCMLW